jgi:hypothetical protein
MGPVAHQEGAGLCDMSRFADRWSSGEQSHPNFEIMGNVIGKGDFAHISTPKIGPNRFHYCRTVS